MPLITTTMFEPPAPPSDAPCPPPAAGPHAGNGPLPGRRPRERRGAPPPPLASPTDRTDEADAPLAAPALVARLERVIADCRRFQTPLVVLSIRIDAIDAAAAAADGLEAAVAVEFGHRLQRRVRSTDQVMWLGGRDFAVLLLPAGEATAQLVRARLASALAGTYGVEQGLATVALSIGHAVYPLDGTHGAVLAAMAVAARRPA